MDCGSRLAMRVVLRLSILACLAARSLAADDCQRSVEPPPLLVNDPSLGDSLSPGSDKDQESSDAANDKPNADEEKWYSIFGQATMITDWHGPFSAAYTGPHSLIPVQERATSATFTAFLGARLWEGMEIYFNPEIAGGRGFSDVAGVAGFPNGEIPRVDKPEPTPYVARFYLTRTIGLGGEEEKVAAGPNQVATTRDVSRITVAIGKLAATDWFDLNRYSHDPRSQFQNWSIMYNGAWDYPADVRGYDYGGVFELNQKDWAIRYGLFGEPTASNGPVIDPNFAAAHGQIIEGEYRYLVGTRPGKARLAAYWNRALMGSYNVALSQTPPGGTPNVDAVGTYRSIKYGFLLNLEQELSDDLGAFARFGWNDGHTESWAFTEIDQTISFGIALKGTRWNRPQDVYGCALAFNGISTPHANYLAAGGLGFILGDGALTYGTETILETYYSCELSKDHFWVTPDFQVVTNPGYNRDRGPVVPMFCLRLHGEF